MTEGVIHLGGIFHCALCGDQLQIKIEGNPLAVHEPKWPRGTCSNEGKKYVLPLTQMEVIEGEPKEEAQAPDERAKPPEHSADDIVG